MIIYHGTPLGGKVLERPQFLRNRHALVPFVRNEDANVVAKCCRSFVFDNGAFSAWRSGEPITDWNPYREWCLEWWCHPGLDWVIIPDVIDGTEDDNDKQINDWFSWKKWASKWSHIAAKSVPVWHLHESIARLSGLAFTFQRVAFGSSGDYSNPGTEKWAARMHEAFEAITLDGGPVCKVHGLRMADPAIFHRFPFSSVDSTNVAQNASREAKKHGVSVPLGREIIAARIEVHNSADEYVPKEKQLTLIYV